MNYAILRHRSKRFRLRPFDDLVVHVATGKDQVGTITTPRPCTSYVPAEAGYAPRLLLVGLCTIAPAPRPSLSAHTSVGNLVDSKHLLSAKTGRLACQRGSQGAATRRRPYPMATRLLLSWARPKSTSTMSYARKRV